MTNEADSPQVPRTHGKVPTFVQIPVPLIHRILSLKLTGTQHDLLLYLWTLDPYGDRWVEIPSPEEIAPILHCDARTISRAFRRLVQAGLIDSKRVPCHQKSHTEQQVRDRLHQSSGGLIEVETALGRIDLLTESEVIEVKNISDWKAALRQVLAYGAFYPEHQKRLHLFGTLQLKRKKWDTIQATCTEMGTTATFEEVEDG